MIRALVLEWVMNDKYIAIVLVDNGIEEMGYVLGTFALCFVSAFFSHILV